MQELCQQGLKLVEQVNGANSIFNLDMMLTRVSVLSDVEAGDELIA
jgi:hypothetical protein